MRRQQQPPAAFDGTRRRCRRRHSPTASARRLCSLLLVAALASVAASSDPTRESSATATRRLPRQHLATTPAEDEQGDGGAASSSAAAATTTAPSASSSFSVADPDVEYLYDPVERGPAIFQQASEASDPTSTTTTTTNNATTSARQSWRARPWHSRMRELFPDVLADGHEALELSPSRHGWVNKTGVADLASWSLAQDEARLDAFFRWRTDKCGAARDPEGDARTVASGDAFTCPQARHPPTPFPGCHVFVNHAYRFIYIRSPKSASTSIVDVLGECGNSRTAAHEAASCMKHSWEGAMTVEEIERVWKDYFVFGFVRNPWKRAYSLYKYLHSDGCMQDGLRRPECSVPWDEFCEDPWQATDVLHRRDCLTRSKSYTYFHMVDQWHCMRTAQGESAVDFVGSVETGDEDWREILAEINRRRNTTAAPSPLPESRLGVSNVRKGRVAGPYNGEHSHCLDAVSRWYSCDAEMFGYLPRRATEPVPAAAAAAGRRRRE